MAKLPVVLVHGAWHSGSCWSLVRAGLEHQGFTVYTPDLPGHGASTVPPAKTTLNSYVSALASLLDQIGTPVLLAGHSMAGFPVTLAATQKPGLVAKLVYLCAYLPEPGLSLFDLIARNRAQEAPAPIELALQISTDKRSCLITESAIRELFYQLAPVSAVDGACRHFAPQATLPLSAKAMFDADVLQRIPRIYIACTEDRVLPLTHQHRMLVRQACQKLLQIRADHSPFLSCPDMLTALLAAEAIDEEQSPG